MSMGRSNGTQSRVFARVFCFHTSIADKDRGQRHAAQCRARTVGRKPYTANGVTNARASCAHMIEIVRRTRAGDQTLSSRPAAFMRCVRPIKISRRLWGVGASTHRSATRAGELAMRSAQLIRSDAPVAEGMGVDIHPQHCVLFACSLTEPSHPKNGTLRGSQARRTFSKG